MVGFIAYVVLYNDHLRLLYDQYLPDIIQNFINDIFGTKIRSSIEEQSPIIEGIMQNLIQVDVNKNLQNKITNQVFDTLYWISIVVAGILFVKFLYIIRLTKQLYQKNKIIDTYYQSTIDFSSVYKQMIINKKNEIDFMSQFGRK